MLLKLLRLPEMPQFKVVKKSHIEKPGNNSDYIVFLKSPEGYLMKLAVDEKAYLTYIVGEVIAVEWSSYQKKLEDVVQ